MRGGTSTGLVIQDQLAPSDLSLREELLRHLMGVPLKDERPGNRQITGLGRGPATSNKVFFVDTEIADERVRLVSTLAQLAAAKPGIDWSVNCGNMSAALPLWAFDGGLMSAPAGPIEIKIRNTNTGVITTGRMVREIDGMFAMAQIPGVDGAFPSVDLFLQDPVGAKTGRLLPTGKVCETVAGHTVSCVDVAVPMVIADAAEFGKTGQEAPAELEGDIAFMAALRAVWVEAGLRMGLRRRDGARMTADDLAHSETIPKICIIAPPCHGGSITVRYFTPQSAHASMAVSGGCCLAAATLIPGTVAYRFARSAIETEAAFSETMVAIENPAGVLDTTIVARLNDGRLEVRSAAYRRSAQILLRGYVPLYRASSTLRDALVGRPEI
jgi:2-methylaconitate cis-trans-isomerase PrpF